MSVEHLATELENTRKYFERSTSALEESDSSFIPVEGMFTVAQQVYHVAQTIDWAIEGFFGKGWNMDFESHDREVREVVSLTEARAALARAFENAQVIIRSQSEEQLMSALADDDPIMPGKPRASILELIEDHTAHHRGALTVYARLLGKTAPMPYM